MSDRVYNKDIKQLLSLAKDGDVEAQRLIVEENIGLVHSVVKRFYNRGHETEDLFQIGCIGLIKAINNFNMEFNVKFSTYAVPMIIGEIKRFIRDDGIIKVSRSLKELAIKAMSVKEAMIGENKVEPTVKEIAKRMNVSPEEVATALEASAKPESIYNTLSENDGSGKALVERLECEQNYEEDIINKMFIKRLINEFADREKKIIILRYFKQKTQSQIADMLGISQVQVSRIEKKVLEKMREQIADL